MHYCMVKLPCSNFRVITTNFLGVQIFRSFMVSYDLVSESIIVTSIKNNNPLLDYIQVCKLLG